MAALSSMAVRTISPASISNDAQKRQAWGKGGNTSVQSKGENTHVPVSLIAVFPPIHEAADCKMQNALYLMNHQIGENVSHWPVIQL